MNLVVVGGWCKIWCVCYIRLVRFINCFLLCLHRAQGWRRLSGSSTQSLCNGWVIYPSTDPSQVSGAKSCPEHWLNLDKKCWSWRSKARQDIFLYSPLRNLKYYNLSAHCVCNLNVNDCTCFCSVACNLPLKIIYFLFIAPLCLYSLLGSPLAATKVPATLPRIQLLQIKHDITNNTSH